MVHFYFIRISILVIALFIMTGVLFQANAQSLLFKKESQAVYLEFLGNGIVYSVNYERTFWFKQKQLFAWRIGGSFIPKYVDFGNENKVIIPFEVSRLWGKRSFFELGLAFMPVFNLTDTEGSPYFLSSPRFGYRYQNKTGSLLFRFGITPILPVNLLNKNRIEPLIQPWIGFTFGYRFKHKNDCD